MATRLLSDALEWCLAQLRLYKSNSLIRPVILVTVTFQYKVMFFSHFNLLSCFFRSCRYFSLAASLACRASTSFLIFS